LLSIDTAFADDLFEKLLFKEVNGEKIERRTRQPRDEKSRAVHGIRSRARPLTCSRQKTRSKKGAAIVVARTPYATLNEMVAFRARVYTVGEFNCESTGGASLPTSSGHQSSRFRFNICSRVSFPKVPALPSEKMPSIAKTR
jgi:hypothetical protein